MSQVSVAGQMSGLPRRGTGRGIRDILQLKWVFCHPGQAGGEGGRDGKNPLFAIWLDGAG